MAVGEASATRLYALLAREGDTGVVFRRGPSTQVQLIRWHLRGDTFEHGQWFKGRIYERRCDLSPNGEWLVYFAANHRGSPASWTALSKPPFLTALALWPKEDCWGGGGVFEDATTLLLNHRFEGRNHGMSESPRFHLPDGLRVLPFGQHSGGGEDEPIHGMRCQRDGWRLVDPGAGETGGRHSRTLFRFTRPECREKTNADGLRLQSQLQTVGRRNAAWYGLDHRVLDTEDRLLLDLPGSDWADWHGRDLVFARDGCLYRLPADAIGADADALAGARLLHDFRDARFVHCPPTEDALQY